MNDTPSQIGKFLRTAAGPEIVRSRSSAPAGFERHYYRFIYFLARKLLKKAHPLHYARYLASIVSQVAKGPYEHSYDTVILVASDAISMTESLEAMIEQLERGVVMRNVSALEPNNALTIRQFCIHETSGQNRYADAGEHIAAHAIVTSVIAQLLQQPKHFFVGANDEMNVRKLNYGLKNLVIYMESVLSVRI